MYDSQRQASHFLGLLLQRRETVQRFSMHKDEEVLSVPPGDVWILPDPPTQAVDWHIVVSLEVVDPVIGPLLVHVPRSTLKGYRCGKKDNRRESYETLN